MALRTPLYDWHVARGGRMVEFSGWMLPVQYTGIVAEHSAARYGGDVRFERAEGRKADEAEFIMLRDGGIAFEGNAGELRAVAARDPYIQAFLS